jgi:hypothetical protein
MKPLQLPREVLDQLPLGRDEVPIAGPDGRTVGYFLSPDRYEFMRKTMYDWAFAQFTPEQLAAARADPRLVSTRDVLRQVMGGT